MLIAVLQLNGHCLKKNKLFNIARNFQLDNVKVQETGNNIVSPIIKHSKTVI